MICPRCGNPEVSEELHIDLDRWLLYCYRCEWATWQIDEVVQATIDGWLDDWCVV